MLANKDTNFKSCKAVVLEAITGLNKNRLRQTLDVAFLAQRKSLQRKTDSIFSQRIWVHFFVKNFVERNKFTKALVHKKARTGLADCSIGRMNLKLSFNCLLLDWYNLAKPKLATLLTCLFSDSVILELLGYF